MNQPARAIVSSGAALIASALVVVHAAPGESWQVALTSATGLGLHGAQASVVTHNGQRAVRLVQEPRYDGESYAVVPGPALQDGTIDVDVAGRPAEGANDAARGFVGIAFRVPSDHS